MPGSSEPYTVDDPAGTSTSPESEADPELSAVPEHPHSKSKAPTDSKDAQSRHKHQLSSVTHPIVSRPTQHACGDSKGSDVTVENTTIAKRKSIGSKLLSKFKPGSGDEKREHSSHPKSQATSGSQTPAYTHHESESESTVGADQLQQALTKEQQRQAKTKQQSFSSIDGLRHRRLFLSRRLKHQQPESDSEADHEESEHESAQTPRYASIQSADLGRLRSNTIRHLPGGLYDDDLTTYARPARDSQALDHLDRSLGLDDGHEDHLIDDHHQYDSDDSDDTIAHLIRQADGYDSLRYNTKGQMSAGLDYDTLHAIREKERSVHDNKDAQSGFSAYSGGAAKALSQPLLELEDIELETFLQNFARHTKEVTVTRAAGAQKYRMPKWSDFRVSPEEKSAPNPDSKRPSMLARVDRGLHHLSENLNPQSMGKSSSKQSVQDRSQTVSSSIQRSKSTEDELAVESASDANDHGAGSTTPSKKKSKPKKLKKHNTTSGALSPAKEGIKDEENWDLIVPSSAEHNDLVPSSPLDELRVDAADEGVDGVAFCIAYILALVERLAPEEIDHHPDRGYREGLIRSHLERLYTIAPFWEQLAFRIRRLYRWEDPKTTAAAAMIYFVLWYTNMIPTAFILMIMFYIMRFKYFPPSESYLHDKVKMRMARGQAANSLSEKLRRRSRLDILNIYKRWVVTFGAPTQETMGLVADFHEKVKNLILWRNTGATRRTLIMFGVLNLFVTFAPSQYISKAVFFFLGITFFCLLPLQSYFPSHRKALSPLWWATFGAPTDAQFAVQLLRERHLDVDRFAGQLSTAEDIRRAVRSQGGSKVKPRPDRREKGIAYDEIEDPARASLDYVEMSNDAMLKPRKLGSFFCQYKGLPGRLHVNTKYLYFTPLHSPSHKRGRTPVEAIESIVKTKSIRLMVWSSLGLKIVRNNGKAPLLLANMQNRDEAFNLILAVSTNGK